MKRDLSKLEIEQLNTVVKMINEKLELKSNDSLNKHNQVIILYERIYKKDNLLYSLNETGFDFRNYMLPILKHIVGYNIDLFVFNNDQSGALRIDEAGFAYKKSYKVEFHITITKQEVVT